MESEHLKPSTRCLGHRKATDTVACGEEDSEGHNDPWAAHAFLQMGSDGAVAILYQAARTGDPDCSDPCALALLPLVLHEWICMLSVHQ